MLCLSATTRQPYGDLSRIGALSDDLFGWRAAQPAVPASLLVSSPIGDADILVVGDSFSLPPGPQRREGLVWQSRLVAAGYRVATAHWDRAHPMCPDFDRWVQSIGFHGRWVVLESVEREIAQRLANPTPCDGQTRPGPEGFATVPPPSAPPPATFSWHEQLLTGVMTRWHSHQARTAAGTMTFQDLTATSRARLHRVPAGCDRFSHALCDRALFLADDEERPRLQGEQLATMVERSRPGRPWQVVWLIIPNKTTFYLDRDTVQATFAQVSAMGLGPDILHALISGERASRDIYYPNDSHLSTAGSLLLGDAVVHWLRRDAAPRG